MKDKFANIHTPVFKVYQDSVTTEQNRCTVKQNKEATMSICAFTLIQFILGAGHMVKDHKLDEVVETTSMYHLLAKLSAMLIEVRSDPEPRVIKLDRFEVKIIKYWLEARMQHCERERDERSPKFNPDTYISQKLLLIDIREWLLGEIIE